MDEKPKREARPIALTIINCVFILLCIVCIGLFAVSRESDSFIHPGWRVNFMNCDFPVGDTFYFDTFQAAQVYAESQLEDKGYTLALLTHESDYEMQVWVKAQSITDCNTLIDEWAMLQVAR
jgi:hypothetical protein